MYTADTNVTVIFYYRVLHVYISQQNLRIIDGRGLGGVCDCISHFGHHIKEIEKEECTHRVSFRIFVKGGANAIIPELRGDKDYSMFFNL